MKIVVHWTFFIAFLTMKCLQILKVKLIATQHPEQMSSRRHDQPFNSTTPEELKVFLAISIMTGVIKLAEIHL